MRRLDLASSILLLLSIAPTHVGPAAPVGAPSRTGLLVTAAEVEPRRAALWLRAEDAATVRVRYAPRGREADARTVDARPRPEADHTARVALSDLAPGTRYGYEVRAGAEVVAGEFATAPAPGADAPVHLLWSGDLGGRGHCRGVEDGYAIFRAMRERGADFFLFVGDTIYADHRCGGPGRMPGADFVARSLSEFHAKHRYNRADSEVQRFLRRTGVYAIWDDHEVTNNFTGPDEPLMPAGRRAFLDYWPIAPDPGDPARLYRSVRWGRHVEVFILDTRQYRSANDRPDGPGKTMLGEAQRTWLLDRVAGSDATWKIVVSSVPLGMFTGAGSADAWSGANLFGFRRLGRTGFAHERDLILGGLRDRGVANLVFLSGEVHHGELVRHEPFPGWVVHEFVAGPLAARTGYPRPLDRSLSSRSLGSVGFTLNFGEIVADGESLDVRLLDVSGAARVALRLPADRGRQGGHS